MKIPSSASLEFMFKAVPNPWQEFSASACILLHKVAWWTVNTDFTVEKLVTFQG